MGHSTELPTFLSISPHSLSRVLSRKRKRKEKRKEEEETLTLGLGDPCCERNMNEKIAGVVVQEDPCGSSLEAVHVCGSGDEENCTDLDEESFFVQR